ncbi:unnamed protein product [Orchesella dallaii]|uniref:Uncharacterized protein n=1 Tax=Orchesella dallaii TaxID=48710 RepID=A0ABP1PMY7_9HEXA
MSYYFENLGIFGDESSKELWEHDKKRSTSTNSDKESDLEMEKGNVEEYRSFSREGRYDFDYSDCPKTTSTKVLGSEERVVWILPGINSLIDLEAAAGDANCVVEIQGRDGKEISLRFYFDKFELVTNGDCRVRYLSLYVDVLKGDLKEGEGLNFVVKVVRLTDSFWTHFSQMPETAVYIRKPEDRRGKLVESYFLQYLRSPLPVSSFRGQVNRSGFLLESTDNLNFGIKVTMINSVATKKEVFKETEGASLPTLRLKPVESSAMEKVLPPLPTGTIVPPNSEETSEPKLKNVPTPQEISIPKLMDIQFPELNSPRKLMDIQFPELNSPPKLMDIPPPRDAATPKLMELHLLRETTPSKLMELPRTELKEASAAVSSPEESSSSVTAKETLSSTSTLKSMKIPASDLIETPSPPQVFGRGRGRIRNIPDLSSVTIPREESPSPSIYSSPRMLLVEEDNCFSDEGRPECKYQVWPWNLPMEDKRCQEVSSQ